MATDQDIQDIKNDLAEIKKMLKNAGLSINAPQKVVDISVRAKEIKERLEKRRGGKTDRP